MTLCYAISSESTWCVSEPIDDFQYLWLGQPWLNYGFTLALSACELRVIFLVSAQCVN